MTQNNSIVFSQPADVLPAITAAILAVGYPMFTLVTFQKTQKQLKNGSVGTIQYYRRIVLILIFTLLLVGINYLLGTLEPVTWIPGFNRATLVFSVLIVLFIIAQLRQKIKPEDVLEIRSGMDKIWMYLPKSASEFRWYLIFSITAGICEEVIFRYYLYHYFHIFVPAPVAIVILNLLFAISRAHTGFQNMVSAFVLGMIFSVIYYFSGYLILPIILHTAIEIQTGTIGFRVHKYINSQAP